jgi:ketosteroid isomerase-like protein
MYQASALDIVTSYQDAWTTRDFDAAAGFLAEDFHFRSPQQHLTSAKDAITMLTSFVERIAATWEQIAVTTEGDNVLILYNLFMPDGTPATCADYFTVRDEQIQSETLVFDPVPFLAAQTQQQ